jgi:hypothetical protein
MRFLTCLPLLAFLAFATAACGDNRNGAQHEAPAAISNSETSTDRATDLEEPAPFVDQAQRDPAPDTLPATASPLALVGLAGAVSLVGALGLKLLRRR